MDSEQTASGEQVYQGLRVVRRARALNRACQDGLIFGAVPD